MTIVDAPEQFVVIGKDILLTCHYNSSPTPSEVQWKKDGTVISRNDSIENFAQGSIAYFNESQVQLKINASTSEVTGNYTCLVINSVHNSSATTSLVVQGLFLHLWCEYIISIISITSPSDISTCMYVTNEYRKNERRNRLRILAQSPIVLYQESIQYQPQKSEAVVAETDIQIMYLYSMFIWFQN